MTPWALVDRAQSADGTRYDLLRRGEHFSIRVNGQLLMNSRVHGSEETLAEMALSVVVDRQQARVLIGGLGFGYTLAAALARLGSRAIVTVAEIAPVVIQWNRELLGELNGKSLGDPRARVICGDVCDMFRSVGERPVGERPVGERPVDERSADDLFDAILLDVDNGPRAVGRPSNGWLYSAPGLEAIRATLKPGGVLAIWSAGPEVGFSERLRAARFSVVLHRVQSHAARTRERHFIWLGTNVQ